MNPVKKKNQLALISITLFILVQSVSVQSQPLNQRDKLTRQDTLRGSLTPERIWWDVVKYDLHVTPNFKDFTIKGNNSIYFRLVKKKTARMQIDLQDPLIIDSAILNGVPMSFSRDGNVWFIEMPKRKLPKSISGDKDLHQIRIVYHGVPKPALRAPWDGGIVWKKDKNGNPWINVACQGLGASVWWPCKDHQSDEPDNGVSISVTAPDTLMNVSLKDFMARTRNTGIKQNRTTKIDRIEVFGNAATAKLTVEYPTFYFHDMMSLIKTKDGWKIVSKIFYREDKKK